MTRKFVNAKCPACGRRLKGWTRRIRGASTSPRLPAHKVGGAGIDLGVRGIQRQWCQASDLTIKEAVVAGVRNV